MKIMKVTEMKTEAKMGLMGDGEEAVAFACPECDVELSAVSASAHLRLLHFGDSLSWTCGDCAFVATELDSVLAHCLLATHDVSSARWTGAPKLMAALARLQTVPPSPPPQNPSPIRPPPLKRFRVEESPPVADDRRVALTPPDSSGAGSQAVPCSVCGSRITAYYKGQLRVINLVIHTTSCLSMRPWACPSCDKMGVQRTTISDHIRKAHADSPELGPVFRLEKRREEEEAKMKAAVLHRFAQIPNLEARIYSDRWKKIFI